MNNGNEIKWTETVWKEINDAVKAEVCKVRVAQKVFCTKELDNNLTEIPNEVIRFPDLSTAEGRTELLYIDEGITKPFVEIYSEFSLTTTQVKKELESKNGICKTLARMAAKGLALAEDIIIFQGEDGPLPANVKADLVGWAKKGLLGEASPPNADDEDPNKVSKPILVDPAGRSNVLYGENTFAAVAEGIAQLVRKAQAPGYALFLPTKVYADTYRPPGDQSLVTTAERIKPMVEDRFYGTGTLPKDKGLLVALGGEPTSLFVGREATTEFVRSEGSKHIFKVMERVQFVVRDPRSFVLLEFLPVEIEKNPVGAEKNPVEIEKNPVGAEKNPVGAEKNPVGAEKKPVEAEKKK